MYKLLIVDDEPLVRRGITTLVDLQALGIDTVYEAANGQEGLVLFQQHQPELVLVDVNMPKMNGLDLAAEIKGLNPDTRIAIITGYDYFDYAVTALKIGVEDYILKPVTRGDVSEVLAKLIARCEEGRQHQEVARVLHTLLKDSGAETDRSMTETIQAIIDRELQNSSFSLVSLAGQMGFSAGHLSGVFKKLLGQPFQDYVLARRLEQAKLLLLTTELKNYEIAEAVGFDDVNYFSTRFRKRFGFSPRQYKERVRGSHETH